MNRPIDTESLAVMKRCPRFIQCTAPRCPLDPLQERRTELPGEPRCTLSKSKRLALGRGTALPRQGLTKMEWARREAWHRLSETEKASRLAHLRPFRSNMPRGSEALHSSGGPERVKRECKE